MAEPDVLVRAKNNIRFFASGTAITLVAELEGPWSNGLFVLVVWARTKRPVTLAPTINTSNDFLMLCWTETCAECSPDDN
jgi:hypothetical protein